MFKVHSDFLNAATRGAIAVVESNIMAINPGEDAKIQMYIWNNMFFSLGFDVKDHYKEFGGDYAAYSAPINDLQGVKALNMLDIDGLHTLGTVVVDYKGLIFIELNYLVFIVVFEQFKIAWSYGKFYFYFIFVEPVITNYDTKRIIVFNSDSF